MWKFPNKGNHIIQYDTGDGFRTKLVEMMTSQYLFISSRMVIDTQFKNTKACCSTVHGLTKILNNSANKYSTIVLDVRLPRIESKVYKNLYQLCIDKNLIILHSPLSDVESINTLMTLLPVTKNKLLNLQKWNLYVYDRLKR